MPSVDEIAEICKLLGDKNRLAVMKLLQQNEYCVSELVDFLQTSQPNVSQHIRKLKSGGLVQEDKRGQWVYYSLTIDDKPYVQELLAQLPRPDTSRIRIITLEETSK